MPTAILVGGGPVEGLTPLVFDAALNVNPRFSNTVTKHPIETGSEVSDHVYKRNTVIDVDGLITNYSVGNIFEDNIRFNRLQTVYDLLTRLHENREMISISSQYQVFNNCVITSLSIPRNAQIGDSLQVVMTLEQLQVVTSQFVQVSQELLDAAANNRNKGQKTGADSNNPNNSTADQQRLEGVSGWLQEWFPRTTEAAPRGGLSLPGFRG